jgi:hypothetical protein
MKSLFSAVKLVLVAFSDHSMFTFETNYQLLVQIRKAQTCALC